MKTTIKAEIKGPVSFGGSHPTIFTKTLELEITPKVLGKIIKARLIMTNVENNQSGFYLSFGITNYNESSNTFEVVTHISQDSANDSEFIKKLLDDSWQPQEEGLKFYKIKLPE